MRPPCGFRRDGRTCFHTRAMPSTTTRSLSGRMRSTRPVLPLSAPVVTRTVSPSLMCLAISHSFSDHFARQRHDLHEVLVAEFTGDGAEDARADRVVFLVDRHGGILVEP